MKLRHIKFIGMLVLCSAVLVYMVVLTLLNLQHFEEVVVKQTQRHLLVIAQTKANHVEDVVNGLLSDMEITASEWACHHGPAMVSRADSVVELANNVYRRFNGLADHVFYLDSRGIVEASAPSSPELTGADFSGQPDVASVLADRGPHISKPFEYTAGVKAVSFCIPVVESDDTIGVLRAVVPLVAVRTMVGAIGLGHNTAWMVDRAGHILSHAEDKFLGRSVFALKLRQLGDEQEEQKVISGMLKGSHGVTSFIADRRSGDKTMVAWAPVHIGKDKWGFAVSADYDHEVAEPIRMHSENIFIMMGCFLVAIAVAGYAYYRLDKKRVRLGAHIAIDRVNDQLQELSLEKERMVGSLESRLKQLKNIVKSIPVCLFWKDVNGVYTGCNVRFASAAGGSSPDDIVGKTNHDLCWSKEQADYMSTCDKEIMRTGIPLLNADVGLRQADGKHGRFLASIVPFRNGDGDIKGVLGVLADTKLLLDQDDSELKVLRLSEAISNMNAVFVAVDAEGTITTINNCASELFNVSGIECTGKRIDDFLPEAVARELGDAIENFKYHGRQEARQTLMTIEQEDYDVTIRAVCHTDLFMGVVMVCFNVSRHTRARQQANDAGSRKSKFITSLSQQIVTTMEGILGYTDALRQGGLSMDQLDSVSMIDSDSQNLLSVVNELVDMSRSETETGTAGPPEDVSDADTADESAPEPVPDRPHKDDQPTSEGPAAPNDQPTSQAPVADKNADEKKDHDSDSDQPLVLVVDDVAENRLLLDVLLKKANYRTTLCADGSDAVMAAQEEVFDVIMMDVQMPGMNGLDATNEIRSKGLNTTTPVIAMTASVSPGDELICLDAGCNDYVRKPIKNELVLRKVWRFIQHNRQIRLADEGNDIISFLADDPDYHKAIEMFVESLPGRISEMQQLLDQEQLKELALKVHAIKGLGSFAGFSVYTEEAGVLEQKIRDNDIEQARMELDKMAQLCARTKLTP